MSNSSPAQVYAATLLASLAKAGVRNYFLAPGARSQALAIAAGQLADAGKINLHVRLDERSLAFNALGAALASGEPSVIITTSGTAVANLHPAVLEANHSGVPLILLTADRPDELRGVGANQTTNQIGIFFDAVREVFEVQAPSGRPTEIAEATKLATDAIGVCMGYDGEQPGPVQLNLAFREPLSAIEPNAATLDPAVALPEIFDPHPEFALLTAAVPTVVVAGAGAGGDAVELAEAFGWPLLAEPSSGSRVGANAILGYRKILEQQPELAGRIGRVIVFGKPTLGRAVIKLLFKPEVEVVVIRSRVMGFFDVSQRATAIVDEITVDDEVDFEWLEAWRKADQSFTHAGANKLDRRSLVEAVWAATEPQDDLILGASRLIREADVWAPAKAVRVYSNRGLAGIDGTVATATGISLLQTGTTRTLMGDLTLLHDASSLAIDPTEPARNIQIIVGNDGGGSIFAGLEMAQSLDSKSFDRLFKTPQSVDIWHLAQAYGWQYVRVETPAELSAALSTAGRILIDVRLD